MSTVAPERGEFVAMEEKPIMDPQDAELLRLSLVEIRRYRNMDRLIPSYHNAVTIATIEVRGDSSHGRAQLDACWVVQPHLERSEHHTSRGWRADTDDSGGPLPPSPPRSLLSFVLHEVVQPDHHAVHPHRHGERPLAHRAAAGRALGVSEPAAIPRDGRPQGPCEEVQVVACGGGWRASGEQEGAEEGGRYA